MRRKRKRTRLKPAPILWLLLIANVTAGLLWSPITSIVRARVDGARPFDEPRIRLILEKLKGIPCAQVNPHEYESAVMSLPEVRTADLDRSVFGTALLRVSYRRAVARIRNTDNLALSIDGVLFPTNEPADEKLPFLELPKDRPRVLATIASPWRPVAIADLAVKAREMWPTDPLLIQVDERGSVCLNISTGRVILGSATDLDKKLGVLRERLSQNPRELQEVEELNLTAPELPSVVRKKSQ